MWAICVHINSVTTVKKNHKHKHARLNIHVLFFSFNHCFTINFDMDCF